MPGLRRIGHTKIDPRTRRSIAMLAQEGDLIFGDGLSVDGTITGIGGGSLITINLADPSGLIKTDGLAIDPKDSGGMAIDTDGLYIVLDTPAHGLHMSLASGGLSIDDDYVFNTGDTMSGDYTVTGDLIVQTDFSVLGTFIPRDVHFSWDGLVGYWPGNSDGHDYGPYGLQGTWTGAQGYTTGRFGSCFNLDGSNYVTSQNTVNTPNGFTIAGWIWLDSGVTDILPSVMGLNTDGVNANWILSYDNTGGGTDGEWRFSFNNGVSFDHVYSGAQVPVDQWVFLTITYDDTDVKFYENAVLINTANRPGAFPVATGVYSIGTYHIVPNVFTWEGKLDELMIFDRTFVADEIKSLYERRESFETFGHPIGLYIGDDVVVPSAGIEISGGSIGINDDLTVGGDLYLTGELIFNETGSGLAYGSLYQHEAVTTINLVKNNYVKITGFTPGLLNAISVNSDAFNVNRVGVYKVNWSLSVDPASVCDIHFDLFVNGVEQNDGSGHRKFGAANDHGNISGTAILDITNAGHDIDIRAKNITNSNDMDVYHANFNIMQIGGT